MFASFDRHLKKANYGFSITTDKESRRARLALKSKQEDPKRKGKSNKPNASVPLNEEVVKLLFDKQFLGTANAEAL